MSPRLTCSPSVAAKARGTADGSVTVASGSTPVALASLGTDSPGRSATAEAGRSASPTARARRTKLAALGLVVNAVTLWNSRYLSAAVDQLRAEGVPVKDEDVARLSPLGHAHINFLGRYAITASTPAQGLRQLGGIPELPDEADRDMA